MTPEEEVDNSDLTEIPSDLSDMGRWVSSFRFSYWRTEDEDRYLELVSRGHAGDDVWALIDSGYCFNKRTRQFVYEMRPSSRTDEFLRDCRMTMDEARKILPRELWRLHSHARRKVVRVVSNYRLREAERAKEADQ